MSKQKVITKNELREMFTQLGIHRGMTLVVHCSLSSLGLLVGGAESFVQVLMDCVQEEGTILFPFQLSDRKDISTLYHDFSLADIQKFRASMPEFNAVTTEGFATSRIAENYRRRTDCVFSYHPIYKWMIGGRDKELYRGNSKASEPFGEDSPVALLYKRRAYCLLLGVALRELTCLHLAEYRSGVFPTEIESYYSTASECWVPYLLTQAKYAEEHYQNIEDLLEKRHLLQRIKIYRGYMSLLPLKETVDLAQAYFIKNKLLF